VAPIAAENTREQQILQLTERLNNTRVLVVYNNLGVYDGLMDDISSFARWTIEPANLTSRLEEIRLGQLPKQPITKEESLNTFPLLVLRKVHMWTKNELTRVLYAFYSKPHLQQQEPHHTLVTAINDLDRVPRLLIDLDTVNCQLVTLFMRDLIKELSSPHMIVPSPPVSTQARPESLRDKILMELGQSAFEWKNSIMRHFFDEIRRDDGTVYVTHEPSSEHVYMVNSAADLLNWRCQEKPLCLSLEMLTGAKLMPQDLYFYWSISAGGVLCIQASSVNDGLRLVFARMERLLESFLE
jgi:hypothetical protein